MKSKTPYLDLINYTPLLKCVYLTKDLERLDHLFKLQDNLIRNILEIYDPTDLVGTAVFNWFTHSGEIYTYSDIFDACQNLYNCLERVRDDHITSEEKQLKIVISEIYHILPLPTFKDVYGSWGMREALRKRKKSSNN